MKNMEFFKKVILTFVIFLACFGVAKINAYSSAVVTGIESFTDESGKDKTKINGMVLDLDKGTYIVGINVNAVENPKASFLMKGKPFAVNNPIDKALFTFTTNIKEGLNSTGFNTTAFVEKQGESSETKEPASPVSGEQECYISYKYKFFCPEDPSISQIAQKTERRGLDIVFVIDRSETVSSIISNMKNAVLGILGKLDSNIDRVGIVSFGNYGTRLFELGNNFSAARTIINNWKAGDKSTNIADGLKKAGEMFGSGPEGGNKRIMILVSDGIANSSTSGECPDNQSYPVTQNKCTNDALAQARTVRSKGISLYTIGYNFAKTNLIKANAGNFAKSLMINVANSSANFSESSDLAKLLSHFDSIVKRNTFYIKKTVGACQNVAIRFNHNGKYEFMPVYSDAYKGIDGTGITWNLGDVDKKGEGASFVIKGIFGGNSGYDINSIGQGTGFGDFEISYKDSKGALKEIGYSHKDILENMVEYPIIENPVAGKLFLAAFSTNCNKDNLETIKKPVIPTQPEEPVIPTTPTTPTDAVEKEQMIALTREISPLDCEKVGVKLTLRCNGSETENKCRWSEFQQYSQNGQYVSGSLKVSDTKKASCKADITGTVSCTTGLLAAGDSVTVDFQLLARKKVDTQGNKLPISNPVIFFDENEGKNRSSSNYLIYHKNDAGDIDYIKINGDYSAQVQDCGQTIINNGDLTVSRDVYPSQNCQEAKIKMTIDCQNKNGCGMIAINEQLSATFGYDAVKVGRFNITAPSSMIVSASVADQRNFSFPLSRSLNYQEKIIIEYSAKTSSSALTQTPNTSDSHIAYNGRRINIPVKQTTINQCISNSEYDIQRTVEPIDCQMAKVNLRIKCNAKQGSGAYCSPVFIYDYLPQGAKHYHKNDSPRLSESGCSAHILPTGAFAGSNIFCHVRYQEMKDGDIKDLVYYIEFDENHTGLQSTTDVSRVSFMQSSRPIYMPDTKVDVKKCPKPFIEVQTSVKETDMCGIVRVNNKIFCKAPEGVRQDAKCDKTIELVNPIQNQWKAKNIFSYGCYAYFGAIKCYVGGNLTVSDSMNIDYDISIAPAGNYDVLNGAYLKYGDQKFNLGTYNYSAQECPPENKFEYTCNLSEIAKQQTKDDIVMVLDVSGSMGSNVEYLRNAVMKFVKIMDKNDRIGIVVFSDEANIVLPLNFVSNNTYINQSLIESHGNTNMFKGLGVGFAMLKNARVDAKKSIIIFSDGGPNRNKLGEPVSHKVAFKEINSLVETQKSLNLIVAYLEQPFEIYPDSASAEFNRIALNKLMLEIQESMKHLSSEEGNYYYFTNPEKISDMLMNIFRKLNKIDDSKMICSNISINAKIPSGIEIISSQPSGNIDSLGNPIWRLPDLKIGESRSLLVKFRIKPGGSLINAINSFNVSYKDYQGKLYSSRLVPIQ